MRFIVKRMIGPIAVHRKNGTRNAPLRTGRLLPFGDKPNTLPFKKNGGEKS
jgi:hypothetical protein